MHEQLPNMKEIEELPEPFNHKIRKIIPLKGNILDNCFLYDITLYHEISHGLGSANKKIFSSSPSTIIPRSDV